MKLSPIEEEKLSFLKNVDRENKQSTSHVLKVNLLGVLIECHLFGLEEAYFEYLKSYYHPFTHSDHKIEKHYRVNYHVFQDERKSLEHRWYGETYPEIHFISDNSNNEAEYIIERDYCALTENKLATIDVYGPAPGEENPDSLDNLFAMLFASCNDQHNALLLHSCAIVKDGKAWVFFGKSGAGKSTLAFHAFSNFNHEIISSDQTLLRIEGEKILAQSTPITIPELDRNSPLRTWDTFEVAGVIHLTQDGEVGFKKLSDVEVLKLFIGQSSFYLTPFSNQQAYMDLCQKILEKNILKGEIKYFRGSNFWTLIPS